MTRMNSDPIAPTPYLVTAGTHMARTLSLVAVIIAGVVLYGWHSINENLLKLYSDGPVMSPLSALGMGVLAIALGMQTRPAKSMWAARAGMVLALLSAAAGISLLLQYLFNLKSSAAEFLWNDRVMQFVPYNEGRPAGQAVLAFIAASIGVAFLRVEGHRAATISAFAQVLSWVIPAIALIGYLYDAPLFFVKWGSVGGMSLPAVLISVLLAVSSACLRFDRPPALWILSSPDRMTLMRLIVMVIAIPIVFRSISWFAEESLELDEATTNAVALLGTGMTIALALLAIGVRERRADTRLRAATKRFAVAFDDAPIGMGMLDVDGSIRQANTSMCMLVRLSARRLSQMTIMEILAPDDAIVVERNLALMKSGRKERFRQDMQVLMTDGSITWVDLHLNVVSANGDDSQRDVLLQMLDLSDRKSNENELTRRATHDSLTGLWNRDGLERYLEDVLSSPERKGKRLSLVFFDLDGFKAVNDTYGHETGDKVLREAADRLMIVVRTDDFVARFGGDEFVMVVDDITSENMELLKQRLRKGVEGPMDAGGVPITIKVSIGVAELDGSNYKDTLIAADQDMYKDKATRS